MQALETVDNQDLSTKRDTWFKIIEDFNVSGQTQISFCKQRDINKDQFVYYLAKWRKNNIKGLSTPLFQPVDVVERQMSDKCLLNFAPGTSIEFPEGISFQTLSELILSLRKALC